ncbi:MAG: hypothetical protein WBA57_01975 [Elainellaceae cyanobacterium]
MRRVASKQSPLLMLGAILLCFQIPGLLPSMISVPGWQPKSESGRGGVLAPASDSRAIASNEPIPVSDEPLTLVSPSKSERESETDGSLDFGLTIRQSLNRLNPINLLRPQRSTYSHGNYDLEALFVGGSDSLVAKAVGGAEGTRRPNGSYTSAYKGHTDPGNGVWNLGTFSYQHGANSPEEADRKQLQRLRQQVNAIQHRAERAGITLGLTEVMNGIDLANQSPLAALGEPGYAEWMAEAYRQGLRGEEAILWARVMGYWDVSRDRWNAPGLGNTEPLIRRDQARRMEAIALAIAAHDSGGDVVGSSSLAETEESSQRPKSESPLESGSDRALSSSLSGEHLSDSYASDNYASDDHSSSKDESQASGVLDFF